MTIPLRARNLGYSFAEHLSPLFSGVDLGVERGEVVAIVGPSGSGKTTLCHCLSGIIPLIRGGVMEGEVLLDGTPTRALRPPEIAQKLGIVFQDPEAGLFFPVVEDEVAFGPENLCVAPVEIHRRVGASLAAVGMDAFAERNPHRLSGGEKQLVATAAVLSLQPDVLILDEAMSQLDDRGRDMMKDMIRAMRDRGKAVLLVEHDPENLDVADRVLMLHDGELATFDGNWDGFPRSVPGGSAR